MKRVVTLFALVVAALVALVPSTASAGGWAVAPLDPLPSAQPGEPLTVGFTLLQHGRSPLDVADFPGATVGLGVLADGERRFVEAAPTGEPGRYTATVDIPAGATDVRFRVEMPTGLAMDEQWTTVPLDTGGAATGWVPTWSVPLFGLGAAACAAMLVTAVRRRPVTVPA